MWLKFGVIANFSFILYYLTMASDKYSVKEMNVFNFYFSLNQSSFLPDTDCMISAHKSPSVYLFHKQAWGANKHKHRTACMSMIWQNPTSNKQKQINKMKEKWLVL